MVDKTGFALTSAYDASKTAATQTSVNTIDGIVDSILATTALDSTVAKTTELLSAGTNDFNATCKTSIRTAVTTSLNAYDTPTKTELDTAEANIRGGTESLETLMSAITGIGGNGCAKKTLGIATGYQAMFNVSGGAIKITSIIGHVTTTAISGANINLRYTSTDGQIIPLCAVVDSGAGVRRIFHITGTAANAMVLSSDEGVLFGSMTAIIVTPGVLSLYSSNDRNGAIDWYIGYETLSSSASVSPA